MKRNLFSITTIIVFICICIVITNKEVFASEIVESGTYGSNISWTLDDQGKLTLSGEGAMQGYNNNPSSAPFYNNTRITSIVIDDGITTVGSYAFNGCSSLTSASIPESVTTISSFAFQNCNKLSNVVMPSELDSIGTNAFYKCTRIINISIPDSVTTIGNSAFSGCSSLTSITLPEGVTSIGQYAFSGCSAFKTAGPIGSGCDYQFGWTTSIPEYAFSGCHSLERITIPNTVTTFGRSSFLDCSSLTDINIPDAVTTIEPYAFKDCASLEDFTVPDNVNNIGFSAFSGCYGLNSISLPFIGSSAGSEAHFGYVFGQDSYSGGTRITVIKNGSTTYYCIPSNLRKVTITGGNKIPSYAFKSCSMLTTISIADGITLIDDYAISDCSRLKTLIIPASVTTIGEKVFNNCSSLETAGPIGSDCNIQYGWTDKIIDYAFAGAEIKSLNIPEGVTSIGCYALSKCSYLNSVTLTSSVTAIEVGAFSNCNKLKDVYYSGTDESWASISIGSNNTSLENATIHCHLCKTDNLIHIEEVAPTCTESGNIEYWHCSGCDKYFSDADCSNVIALEETFKGAIGHDWSTEYTIDQEPTCTQEGLKSYHCTKCGEQQAESISAIDPLGHIYAECIIEATCSQKGHTLHVCGRCGDSFIDTEVPAKGHSFSDWNMDIDSTCTEEGLQHRVCSECGYIETKGLVKKNHSFSSDYIIDKEATCTTDGSMSYHCTADGCTATSGNVVIPAVGHQYTNWIEIKKPSCTEAGDAERKCSVCGAEEVIHFDARGHIWMNEPTVDKASTCTEEGSMSIHCAVCGAHKPDTEEIIDKAGHNWSSVYTIDKKATFSAAGSKSIHCSVCDAVKEGSAVSIPKLTVKGTAFSSVVAAKKGFIAKWKKGSGINGYEIQYALNSKFTKSKKSVKVTKPGAVSKKIANLKAKKKYWVRIRTYKMVSGNTYYSTWSKAKTVTTKN